jgi:hypothetical protein
MKIKAPNLTPGKRATLERTKEWLIDILEELTAKKARLDELIVVFEEAESRKHQFERDAALDPDAALNLVGAEAQLSRLQPEINGLEKSLERETATAARQSNLVRSSELRELLFGPMITEIRGSLEAAIRPFCLDGWEKTYAGQIIERTKQFRQMMFFLGPPPLPTGEFDDVKPGIEKLIGDLAKILAGETLIEA